MKILKLFSALLLSAIWFTASAQFLPHGLTNAEREQRYHPPVSTGFVTPPSSEVRTPAEWEEIDGLCVRWEGTWSRSVLRNIVKHAKEECTVYIVTENQSSVVSHLNQYGIDQNNIVFVNEPSNSIWFRDYGQWNVYTNDVDSLLWVDWIYNRPRPSDDVIPEALSGMLNIPLYQTLNAPYDLVNTGGNFMVDGFGTAFASELILEENDVTNQFGTSDHSENEIDQIMEDFMGIDRYIKMPTLPYDGIHHIDMHMKLLDEETLLVGEYPAGIADGPQIESNLDYVLNNFNSVFGTEYKVIRIPMPPESGVYPDQNGDYRTYTNSVFVNNTILVPTYEEQWDTTALRIYRETLPGYNVVGIDCNEIITASGAIHCITKAVASDDPLLISHQPLSDQPFSMNDYRIDAMVKHADGITSALLYWTTDTTAGYNSVSMNLSDPQEDIWTGFIPYQPVGEKVYYYIHAEATTGKQQNRPMPAPLGYWKFKVFNSTEVGGNELEGLSIYPNPSAGRFLLRTQLLESFSVEIWNAIGEKILEQYDLTGQLLPIDISEHPVGVYSMRVTAGEKVAGLRLVKID